LALLSQNGPPAGLARANASFLAINCLGSVVGPVVAGGAMDWLGSGALFGTGAATIILTLVVWILGRRFAAAGTNKDRIHISHWSQTMPRPSVGTVTGSRTRP
jgi:dipeptide/tripeptide permease